MSPQDMLMKLLVGAQNVVEHPTKMDSAKSVKNPVLRFGAEMGQGIINTPANALSGAATVGQAIRGERKTPQQLLGAGANIASLPLLIASLGAAPAAEAGIMTAARGAGRSALGGVLGGLSAGSNLPLPAQLGNAALQGGLGAVTGGFNPLLSALHMRLGFNTNHSPANGQFATGAIEDATTPITSQASQLAPQMIRDHQGNFVPAPANYQSPYLAKPGIGEPPTKMVSINGRLVPVFHR